MEMIVNIDGIFSDDGNKELALSLYYTKFLAFDIRNKSKYDQDSLIRGAEFISDIIDLNVSNYKKLKKICNDNLDKLQLRSSGITIVFGRSDELYWYAINIYRIKKKSFTIELIRINKNNYSVSALKIREQFNYIESIVFYDKSVEFELGIEYKNKIITFKSGYIMENNIILCTGNEY